MASACDYWQGCGQLEGAAPAHSSVATDPPAKLGQVLAHWRGLHMTQVERRVEQLEELLLEAFETTTVVVRVDGDRQVSAHPLTERLLRPRPLPA